METGKMYRVIVELGTSARLSDEAVARANLEGVRNQMVLDAAVKSPFQSHQTLRDRADTTIACFAGYMPREYGNKVLGLLDLSHPIFGKNLDESVDEALAAGMRLSEELHEAKLAEERAAKRRALLAKGVDLPDSTSAVSSASAKKVLEAIRASKSGAPMPAIAEEDSEFGAVVATPRAVRKNALESMILPKEPEPEVDEDDYATVCEDEFDALPPVPVAPTPNPEAEAAHRAKLLEEVDEAGAW